MKKVIFKKQPLKFLKKQDEKTKSRIIKAIYALPSGDVKPLQGHSSYKRLRVGTFRIIFDDDGKVCIIARIGNRGDIYK
ncbi:MULTISPECIES: type II toxin-antitoxin system RelE family toxin [Enterococcus]|mgnify:FL=1|uniref:Plasmid stabilization system protein, RelE/ParE family n=2 Tax=Enterococcus hirae TaxID=1354 RepID=I6T4H0_ENTHA|nr:MULTISPECIES: type II toxin-antitoxin system RelE/ParE family toxin [Enterococcus]MWO10090.1 type II toxin-antitoxin system RelE/ParE family toxin [Escherichia coli]AFM69536.1 plasmid stabilization system protein, RelE/ParE family [Enterococcus hirae ATCC 9790]EMF0378214.1 type II toxin-antitoxin system RelE/ParE family toxin [Enterococcus hirae]EMF0513171.1 type II toxin-antitoxin system RelE/ParE family toxin [Enterococcus hirae]EOH67577.1 hypothetical protein UAE_02642 [Enterococcus hira